MTVKFDLLEEFVVEMERDAVDDAIADRIVRRTTSRTTDTALVPLLSTVVGYQAHGQLVTCQAERGKLWAREEQNMSATDAALLRQLEVDRRALQDVCMQHGLDLRGGRFQ